MMEMPKSTKDDEIPCKKHILTALIMCRHENNKTLQFPNTCS